MATGIKIKTTDTHSRVNPIAGGNVWGVVLPLLVTSMGVPRAIRNPQIQLNKLAQPQAKAVTTVAMIPIVLFCIGFLLGIGFINFLALLQLRAPAVSRSCCGSSQLLRRSSSCRIDRGGYRPT